LTKKFSKKDFEEEFEKKFQKNFQKRIFFEKKVSKIKIFFEKSSTHLSKTKPLQPLFTLFYPFTTPYLPPKQDPN